MFLRSLGLDLHKLVWVNQGRIALVGRVNAQDAHVFFVADYVRAAADLRRNFTLRMCFRPWLLLLLLLFVAKRDEDRLPGDLTWIIYRVLEAFAILGNWFRRLFEEVERLPLVLCSQKNASR